MKKTLLLTLAVFIVLSQVRIAAADDFSDAIIKAKKKLKTASNSLDSKDLLKVRGDFERILQLKKNEWLVNYYMAAIDYYLTFKAMDAKNNDDIKKYTESSLALLDKSTDAKDDFTEAYILKMAVESNRYIYEFDKLNDIMAKQGEAKDKAKKLDAANPRFYLVDGTNTYYTPSNFGGGADNALPLLQKSWELFSTFSPIDETYPDWGKDQCAGMIALCYIQNDKLTDAKTWMDKAIEINPDNGFIKNYVQKQYDEKAKK